jgi:hypothetical protein
MEESCYACAQLMVDVSPPYDLGEKKNVALQSRALHSRLSCCGRLVCASCVHVGSVSPSWLQLMPKKKKPRLATTCKIVARCSNRRHSHSKQAFSVRQTHHFCLIRHRSRSPRHQVSRTANLSPARQQKRSRHHHHTLLRLQSIILVRKR